MPADQFPKDDPFHLIEGKDGFHVVQTQLGSVLMLSVMAYSGGVPCNLIDGDPNNSSVELLDFYEPTARQRGECDRLRLVMDAVCRYFTTGGTWRELDNALKTTEKIISGQVQFPGYHLVTSYSTTDGDYQHVFAADDGSGRAVLWNEPEVGDSGMPVGGWIESTTLEKIREEQENDETVWGQRRPRGGLVKVEEGEEGPGGPRGPLQLPGGEGVRPPADAGGSSGAGVPGEDAHG